MKYFFSIVVSLTFIIVISLLASFIYFYSQVKFDANQIIDFKPNLTTQIYDRNDKLIANVFQKEHRLYAKYDEIPARVVEALVAIEDTSFFEHSGVNLEAIFRAAIKDIKAMEFVEGASTITQQLIKNTVLSREKKIKRKINEAILALKLEAELSKEEIIERYLNKIYFGHGYYGIKTAATGYFHKQLSELNLKEIAILVGLPKAPSTYDPTKHYDLSLSRANTVLYRMNSLGWITGDEFKKYQEFKPEVFNDTLTQNKAPYIVDEVMKNAKKEYKDIRKGGYKIYTSIDLEVQEIAKTSLQKAYEEIQARKKDGNYTNLNGSIVVMENNSGEVLALVGGVNYKESAFNRAVQSQRQPGSSFKPFIYQMALNYGYSPLSTLTDISRTYTYRDASNKLKHWKPRNYEKNFEGILTLREALVHSRNLATINLVNEIGLDTLYRNLNEIGFQKVPNNLSIALGSFGVSPLDFSSFYTLFSNQGTKRDPVVIKKVVSNDNEEHEYISEEHNITTPAQAFLITDIMKDIIKRGTGKNAKVKGIELVGKTGTTNNYVDAWFCGYSPEIQTVVWFGKDNNRPMQRGETGGRAAAPAFKYFYEAYLKLHPETKREFEKPDGVGTIKIDGVREYFTDISKPPKRTQTITPEITNELLF